MRWDLDLPGETLRCLRPVDTATHPDFERRGIFRLLTTEAVELARRQGFDLIFNTPNPQSGAGYLTMGWREVGPVGVMVRPLLRWGEGVSTIRAEDFFVGNSAIPGPPWPPARSSPLLRTPRSPEYLSWRFTQHPYASYRAFSLAGGTAIVRPNLRDGRKEVVVSDLLGDAPPRLIRDVARKSRARYLAGWFSGGTPERRAAQRGGMIPVPGKKSLLLVANPLRDLPIDAFDITNWDIALSDLELL
jgi:hypothetical protein